MDSPAKLVALKFPQTVDELWRALVPLIPGHQRIIVRRGSVMYEILYSVVDSYREFEKVVQHSALSDSALLVEEQQRRYVDEFVRAKCDDRAVHIVHMGGRGEPTEFILLGEV